MINVCDNKPSIQPRAILRNRYPVASSSRSVDVEASADQDHSTWRANGDAACNTSGSPTEKNPQRRPAPEAASPPSAGPTADVPANSRGPCTSGRATVTAQSTLPWTTWVEACRRPASRTIAVHRSGHQWAGSGDQRRTSTAATGAGGELTATGVAQTGGYRFNLAGPGFRLEPTVARMRTSRR